MLCKIRRRNENLSDLLAVRSSDSLRPIFMSIYHERRQEEVGVGVRWGGVGLRWRDGEGGSRVYGAWIVTLFQLSITFDCSERISIMK